MSLSGIFAIGLSGINAFATGLEAVSSNIANSQTTGYKRAHTAFSDLVTKSAPEAAAQLGGGVSARNQLLVAEQGALTRTDTPTNIAVSGNGFFVVTDDPESASAPVFLFTRNGDFSANDAGDLVNSAGQYLYGALANADNGTTPQALGSLTNININRAPIANEGALAPGELTGVEINKYGEVIASYATGEQITLYTIPLALLPNTNALEQASASAFRTTAETGGVRLLRPLDGSAGAIEGAALEISTVDIGNEFSALIKTQRAYASNARVISVADELLRTVSDLKA